MSKNYAVNYAIGLARDEAGNKPPPPKITKKEIDQANRNSNIFLGVIFLIFLLIILFALKKIIFNKK
jgi:hypothetical protein